MSGAPGHGCGHNLLGVASLAAAMAVKAQLESRKLPGTIRYYGTPAEEGGNGKVYMVRAGLFSDADVVLHWHPNDRNIALAAARWLSSPRSSASRASPRTPPARRTRAARRSTR